MYIIKESIFRSFFFFFKSWS